MSKKTQPKNDRMHLSNPNPPPPPVPPPDINPGDPVHPLSYFKEQVSLPDIQPCERWLITHESSAQYRAARSEVYNGTIQQFLSERKNTYITYAVKI